MFRLDRIVVVSTDPLALDALTRRLADNVPDAEILTMSTRDAPLPDDVVCVWDAGVDGVDASLPPSGSRALVLVDSDEHARRAAIGGALGILPRDTSGERIVAALGAIASGLFVLDPGFLEQVVPSEPAPLHLIESMTPRELQVLHQLALGLTNKEIAEQLGMSPHTAKFHVNSLMSKLGASSRTEAVAMAARAGLVSF